MQVIDFLDGPDNPVTAYYKAQGMPFVMRIPLDHCTCFLLGGFDDDNPLVQTVAAHAAGRCDAFPGSPLDRYLSDWRPATMAQALGIHEGKVSPQLGKSPVDASPPPPWDSRLYYDRHDERLSREGFRRSIAATAYDISEVTGCLFYGPVSDAFGQVTFNRLATIYRSMRDEGYQPARFGSFVEGCVLVDGHNYRVWVNSGKHRMASLAVLGHREIPVLFGTKRYPVLIHREEAGSWPLVCQGVFCEAQAVAVFDRCLAGRRPPDGSGDSRHNVVRSRSVHS